MENMEMYIIKNKRTFSFISFIKKLHVKNKSITKKILLIFNKTNLLVY